MPLAIMQPGPAIAEIAIRLVEKDRPHVVVEGVSTDALTAFAFTRPDRTAWQRVFALYVESDTGSPTSPMLGQYAARGDRLVFTPRFPLKPGLRYRAVFDPAGLPGKTSSALRHTETTFSLRALRRTAPTIVEAIYPSSDVLPENQLKFYIHFSAPMRRGDSYRNIQLLDLKGTPIEAPFLELAEELWDESGRRLTLLLDPGRVKQDLRPHKEVGRALADGGTYVLVISKEWRDASGEKLGREFRKAFRVVKADVRQPDPKRWTLTVPGAGTRQPLVVSFDEPLDHAMLQHVISVSDSTGGLVEGLISVDENETRWSFQPADTWIAGTHRLLIEATLEDLAGNSIARPFEVHLPSGRSAEVGQTVIPFEISGETAESRPQ
jgi:hypothetical protein